MLTFNKLQEKKSKIKINPKQDDLKEAELCEKLKHGEDCDCKICEAKRENEGPDVAKEEVEYVEERDARKMNVRTKGSIKKQIAKDAAAEAKRKEKKTGEYAEKPKRKPRLKKPSQLTKVTGESKPEPKKEEPKKEAPKAAPKAKEKPVAAVKKVAPKPKAKSKPAPKKAAPKPVAKKAAPKPAPKKKAAPKPVAKKEAPKKEAPKSTGKKSVSDRVRDVVKKGVKRHKKAVQPARVFAKGFAKGAKDTVKFAGKLKKAVVGEEKISFKTFMEATRLKKEKGYDKGGTKGKKDPALAAVLAKIKQEHGAGAVVGQGSRQQKKVKGAKSDAGTGKYKKAADNKKQTAADAKKRGFKDVKNYVNTMARYGGKDNYDKGRGLGT